MAGLYHEGNRRLQDAFDSRRLADRLEEVKVRDHIDDGDRAFIESLDMFFLATADEHGRPTCSSATRPARSRRNRAIERRTLVSSSTRAQNASRVDWSAERTMTRLPGA